jgi:SAM-dependent methyltransferase
MNTRLVEPEWLDALPAEHPGAIRSRADLRRVNWLMTNERIVANALYGVAPARVLDLGAGDGAFAARVFELCRWRDVHCTLLDRSAAVTDRVREKFKSLGCDLTEVKRDALRARGEGGAWDVIFTNLFLHHFQAPELERLLAAVAGRCRCFVACEPRRSFVGLRAARLLRWIGCNAVTRHDAVASVRAGFRDGELTRLWPARDQWSVQERPAGLFSHLFIARKL